MSAAAIAAMLKILLKSCQHSFLPLGAPVQPQAQHDLYEKEDEADANNDGPMAKETFIGGNESFEHGNAPLGETFG